MSSSPRLDVVGLSFRKSTLFQSGLRFSFAFTSLLRTHCRQTCARTFPSAQPSKLCFRRASSNSQSSDLSSYLPRCFPDQALLPRSFLELLVVGPELVPSQVLHKPSSASAELLQTRRRQTGTRTFPGTRQTELVPSQVLRVAKLELVPSQVLNKPSSASAELLQTHHRQV